MLGQVPGHACGVVIGVADVLNQERVESHLDSGRSLGVAAIVGPGPRASQGKRFSEDRRSAGGQGPMGRLCAGRHLLEPSQDMGHALLFQPGVEGRGFVGQEPIGCEPALELLAEDLQNLSLIHI